jgi:hypothetical protein
VEESWGKIRRLRKCRFLLIYFLYTAIAFLTEILPADHVLAHLSDLVDGPGDDLLPDALLGDDVTEEEAAPRAGHHRLLDAIFLHHAPPHVVLLHRQHKLQLYIRVQDFSLKGLCHEIF